MDHFQLFFNAVGLVWKTHQAMHGVLAAMLTEPSLPEKAASKGSFN